MILADSSAWIEHFRRPLAALPEMLAQGQLVIHPHVIGELALGSVPDRARLLGFLGDLPAMQSATDPQVLAFIDQQKLHGKGIGYVDAHLLCACAAAGAKLWTFNKRLHAQAVLLGLTDQR